jgi:hypothetical protein
MSSAPQFYIDRSQNVLPECKGCTNITKLGFGVGVGREICTRHPRPEFQFLFKSCVDKHIKPPTKSNEN